MDQLRLRAVQRGRRSGIPGHYLFRRTWHLQGLQPQDRPIRGPGIRPRGRLLRRQVSPLVGKGIRRLSLRRTRAVALPGQVSEGPRRLRGEIRPGHGQDRKAGRGAAARLRPVAGSRSAAPGGLLLVLCPGIPRLVQPPHGRGEDPGSDRLGLRGHGTGGERRPGRPGLLVEQLVADPRLAKRPRARRNPPLQVRSPRRPNNLLPKGASTPRRLLRIRQGGRVVQSRRRRRVRQRRGRLVVSHRPGLRRRRVPLHPHAGSPQPAFQPGEDHRRGGLRRHRAGWKVRADARAL